MEDTYNQTNLKGAKGVYISLDYKMVFIDAVIVRPSMYTINGTLEEVGAFLQGFHTALGAHNTRHEAQAEASHWFDFCRWACQTVTGKQGEWYQLFKALRQKHPDYEYAFGQLALLHITFQGINYNQSRISPNISLYQYHDVSAKDVLIRPQDYTIHETIEEIASFLDGYYSGKYAHRPGFGNEAAWWSDFRRWALLKISRDGNEATPKENLFSVLRKRYEDDKIIREIVFRLIDEFIMMDK